MYEEHPFGEKACVFWEIGEEGREERHCELVFRVW